MIRKRALSDDEKAAVEKHRRIQEKLARYDLIGMGVPDADADRLSKFVGEPADDFQEALGELDTIAAQPAGK